MTEIGSKTAKLLGLDRPVRAPAGHEFVVADFTQYTGYDHDVPAKGSQPGSLKGSKHQQTILVGDTKIPLYPSLVGGRLLIATAPAKSRVLLKVTDSGVTQYLDLRTGLRVKDSRSGYYPGRDFGPTRPVEAKKVWRRPGVASADNLVVNTLLLRARSELSPFRPDGTWEKGKYAWLYLTVQVSGTCKKGYSCSMVMSPDKHVRLRLKGGATPDAVGSSFRTGDLYKVGSTDGTATFAFRVPRSTRSATAVVTPAGPLTVKTAKRTTKPSWRLAPKSITLELSWR